MEWELLTTQDNPTELRDSEGLSNQEIACNSSAIVQGPEGWEGDTTCEDTTMPYTIIDDILRKLATVNNSFKTIINDDGCKALASTPFQR